MRQSEKDVNGKRSSNKNKFWISVLKYHCYITYSSINQSYILISGQDLLIDSI